MPDKDATQSVSESENPAIPSPEPKGNRPRTNKDWWPNQLDLSILHQRSPLSNPMGEDFNYADEFQTLDLVCDCRLHRTPGRARSGVLPADRRGGYDHGQSTATGRARAQLTAHSTTNLD